MRIESGFVIPQAMLLVLALLVVGGGIALVASSGATQNDFSQSDDEASALAELEREVNFAAKSGGVSPDTYERITDELDRLENAGGSTERIRALRELLGTLEVGGSKAVAKTGIPSPKPPPPAPPPPPPPIAPLFASLPLYDRTTCPDSSEGNDIFIRNGIRYRVDQEVRRWAEEFCGPDASTPLVPTPPPEPSQPPQPACESNASPSFTNHITDMSKVNYIGPPPTMGAGPSLKPHSYIGTDHARVPVYAPTDMTLETGAYFEGGPYGLDFRVSCEVTLRFGHITEPIEEIRAVFPATPAPANDSRSQQITRKVSFKAGELVGYTTGTSAAGNWDFGVYNSTVRNRYADDPAWNISATYTTAVCPFDYFSAAMRAAYVAKFNSAALGGNLPHGDPFCKI